MADSEGNWTSDHKLLGISYVVLKMEYDAEAFGNGLPEISFVVKGQKTIYDPRTNTTGYSNNAALCLAHYQTLEQVGPAASYADEIDEAELIAAANICDESVALAAGGSEKRYTVNGAIFLDQTPEDNMSDFIQAMAGWSTFPEGKFVSSAGAYVPPTFEITEDMMTGSVRLKNKAPKRDRANVIKGLYTAAENRYQRTDFPSRRKQSYIDADGQELIRDMDLDLVASPAQAQRIANIELEKGRLEKSIELTCNLRAFPAQTGKNVMLTIPRYGWARKVFQVVSFNFNSDGDGGLQIELSLKKL
mgnify:CR=1 FL=1